MMRKRLFAVVGSGVVLAAILTGSVFARGISSNTTPTVEEYQLSGLAHSVESEDSESQSVYIDLSNRQGPSEDDAQYRDIGKLGVPGNPGSLSSPR